MLMSAGVRSRRPFMPLVVFLSALLVFSGLIAARPVNAQASANKCAALSGWGFQGIAGENICLQVAGSGLRVDTVYVDIAAPITRPANVFLKITFFDYRGNQYEQFTSPFYRGATSRATYQIFPHRNFKTGRVCGALTINGSLKGGPCADIYP
ncbi:hypothetical protein GCM10027519_34490 [Kineococcus endophyticus]